MTVPDRVARANSDSTPFPWCGQLVFRLKLFCPYCKGQYIFAHHSGNKFHLCAASTTCFLLLIANIRTPGWQLRTPFAALTWSATSKKKVRHSASTPRVEDCPILVLILLAIVMKAASTLLLLLCE